jgi:hypothetical protein
MPLLKALWQLGLAIATAFINIGRLIVTSVAWPITWLAERIGRIATSVQSIVERLEQKLEAQYPGSTDDPITKIVAIIFIVVVLVGCSCIGFSIISLLFR